MCLAKSARKYVKPKNFTEGYKVLMKGEKRWKSYFAKQFWEFAELVNAKLPRNVMFSGEKAYNYRRGIHAYKIFADAQKVFKDSLDRPSVLFVKVLLFGVTHYDRRCYRADSAIIIETLNGRTGERISWPERGE